MENHQEEWRPIPDWEGLYEVSNLGRVRSVPREQVRRGKTGKPTVFRYGYKLLSPGKKDTGYLHVVLSDMTNGRQKVAKIHQLVCEAFHGPKPGWDYEVAHNDHSRDNNVASNLRWATHYENIQDCVERCRAASDGVATVAWGGNAWIVRFAGRQVGKYEKFDDAASAIKRRIERHHANDSSGVETTSAA